MKTLDPRGRDQFGPNGLDWRNLCKGLLDIGTYQIYICCGLYSFIVEYFERFSHISLWELYVAMTTRVPIQSVQKPYAAFSNA